MATSVPEITNGSLYRRWDSVGAGGGGDDTNNSDTYLQAGLEPVTSYTPHRQVPMRDRRHKQTLNSARELGYRQDR
jgi:hypothetical protein